MISSPHLPNKMFSSTPIRKQWTIHQNYILNPHLKKKIINPPPPFIKIYDFIQPNPKIYFPSQEKTHSTPPPPPSSQKNLTPIFQKNNII